MSATLALRGAAALSELLDCIGGLQPDGEPIDDHAAAKVLVDSEMELRGLLRWVIDNMGDEA